MPARLPSLTGLRFWAALLVVLYHLARQVGGLPLVGPAVWYGRSGVTFFFVLSGTVLAWTYADAPVPATRFYRRRLARVWPLHALATGLSLAVYAWIGTALPLRAALCSLLLLHPWFRSLTMGGNPAGWSLGDEAWFYLLFPVLLPALTPRRLRPLGLLCLALGPLLWVAGAAVADPALRSWLLDYLPLTRTPQFLLGMAAGLALRRGMLPRLPLGWTALAVAGWHLLLVPWSRAVPDPAWDGPYSASQLLSAPLFAALIAAAAQADLTVARTGPSRTPWPARPLLVRLGDWSFAWYLTHEIVVRCWLHALGHPARGAAALACWLTLLAATLALAAALHHYVERPCERRLRGPATALPRPLVPTRPAG
ncbi:acyltransferase family protein [Kitasatospora sp. NPDC056138]|uniref:acyltransferase family protein n=1 Tax=Kitasatospora sp. NPDC056138 TaxID=3345724 RepID=UPI0035DBDB54